MARLRFAVVTVVGLSCVAWGEPITPPTQASSGPGGVEAAHSSVVSHKYAEGAGEYWIYEPSGPRPESAPLVVFSHGWGAMAPAPYAGWIEHIVRRGAIVVYPRYQESLRTPRREFLPNEVGAVHAAIKELQTGDHVKPELDHVAFVGHSMGGGLTANLAAVAADEGLPAPKAIMSVEPGASLKGQEDVDGALEDLSRVPAGTLALVIVGDQDRVVGDTLARMIFEGLTKIGSKDKDFVKMVSDDHGSPALVADHTAPTSPIGMGAGRGADDDAAPADGARGGALRERLRKRLEKRRQDADAGGVDRTINALDYYGTWKLFDALCDAAFTGKNREYALGDTPEQRYMGVWSDGTPVKELVVTDEP